MMLGSKVHISNLTIPLRIIHQVMEGAINKMDRLTVIGKVTIKDTSAVKEWFESKEAKRWFDENWAPTAPGELPSDKIGFYDLQLEIPGLYKYLERTCKESYAFNVL